MSKRKRRLTEVELEKLRFIMESSSQGRKPSIGQLARLFHVNKPSIIKSLGGWEGNMRNRPPVPEKPQIINIGNEPLVKLQEYTTKVEL
jgi:hypothetical protein